MKLPRSFEFALEYPFASAAGYGLARARWIECRFVDGAVPLDVLRAWIGESFRAIAPRRLGNLLAPD